MSGIVLCLKEFFITKTIAAVLPKGPKKGKSNNDDKHDQGQEKRRHSTYVVGEHTPDVATLTPPDFN